MADFETFIHAPEINQPGLTWLNAAHPLSLSDLKGRIVILDFWTFCCINCMHVLPTLQKIEDAFPGEVAVIGVHSPKFAAERDARNVESAMARYNIKHPVIHDPNYILWKQFDVHAWPTLVIIDPNGRVIGKQPGEPEPLHLLNAIRDLIEKYEDEDALHPHSLDIKVPEAPKTTLRFPGKIRRLPGDEKRWLVADSGHNQIVVLKDDGTEAMRFGSGVAGHLDGPADKARFNMPQSAIADSAFIYVADTNNHAIRAIDRTTQEVTTLAGNGERGMILVNQFEKAKGRALASPWDLALKNNYLFYANAGTHQLGAIDLDMNVTRVVAGNGGENLTDGNVLMAELAQPSGLALSPDGNRLYFADSETSSVRYMDMKDASIHTLVGEGLFDFGHVNGKLEDGRLQHALDVQVLNDKQLVVADSYNNAIRLIDLDKKTISDLDDNAWNCEDPVCLPFAEPAGLAVDGKNRILISDTNNHRIVEVRRDEKTTKTFA